MGCLQTNLEKRLLFFVILLGGLLGALIVVLLCSSMDSAVCNTPECVRAATHILDTVDPTVDPCEDFYKFSCGTFLKNAHSLGQPSTLHHLRILTKKKLQEIVVEKDDPRNISRGLHMQRKFYKNCINDTAIEEDNDKTILKLLDQVVGGWPVVKGDSWNGEEFNWTNTMVKARRLGLFYQFYFRVGIYLGNDSSSMIWIKPPYRSDVASFHWKEENVEFMTQIATYLGAQSVERSREIGRTLDFAKQLNLIAQQHHNSTKQNGIERVRRYVELKNLNHIFIKINWFYFLEQITGLKLDGNTMVAFDVENYFKELYYLLLKTPKKIQANYMAWAIISTNVHYMTKKIRDAYRNMTNINDTESNLSRRDLCYKISSNLFKHIAEGEYVRRYTPPSKREYIREMVNNIKLELQSVLEGTEWIDNEMKSLIIRHLKNVTEGIGWTKLLYDTKKFERLFGYHQLRITSNKLVDVARMVAINGVNRYYRQLEHIGQEEEEEYLNTPKLEINAFYLRYFNKLILPAPILQDLIFEKERPYYMNYGALGSVIGHELMHAVLERFSDEKNDSDTSLRTNNSIINFKNVSQCMVRHYERYLNLNGIHSNSTVFEENLADFSGVNLAYAAYVKRVKKKFAEERLPGIKYTPNQLFWIMTGTYLCQDSTLLGKNESNNEAIHADSRYRVIGRLQNSRHFADDFGCSVGSNMNPEKKCQVFV